MKPIGSHFKQLRDSEVSSLSQEQIINAKLTLSKLRKTINTEETNTPSVGSSTFKAQKTFTPTPGIQIPSTSLKTSKKGVKNSLNISKKKSKFTIFCLKVIATFILIFR